jgi:hypothetical protein
LEYTHKNEIIDMKADQKYPGQNLLWENESIYKLLEVISFKVLRSRLYAAIPAIFPLSMHVW